MDVKGRVPGTGDENTVLGAVDKGFDAHGVGGKNRLRTVREVQAGLFISLPQPNYRNICM